MKVLVTGAAGYIGSHALHALIERGHEPVALDNLSRGHRRAIDRRVTFYELDIRETDRIAKLLQEERIECILHFAALAYVGESVQVPLLYYDNNTGGTRSLLAAAERVGVKRFVFSSTCATYGEPERVPIVETEKQEPINPYGWSKLFSERMLFDYSAARPDFGFAALRYFNVAGCARAGGLGEHHDPETHLIPVVLQAALGLRNKVTLFGDDYPTADGTCVRDYIHVEDLVAAHVAVMDALAPGDCRTYNLGIGKGYSVKQIIDAAQAVVQRPITFEVGPRRPGDPAVLYADPAKIARELRWAAKITRLEDIIDSAWRWFRDPPQGYTG